MLNRERHQLVMGRILQDTFSDPAIAPLLGFKGGTGAYFFYGLPRFSVDLDFDLLRNEENDQKLVFETVKRILEAYGKIKDSYIKRNTIFFLLSYGDADHNVKFEVNTRPSIPRIKDHYDLKEYLGISMLCAKKAYLFASKLVALTSRSETAMRDIYDIWFFAENNWDIDAETIKIRTNKSVKAHLADCVILIEQVRDNQILQGLGELLSEKDKVWVKTYLRKKVVLLLKNYASVISG